MGIRWTPGPDQVVSQQGGMMKSVHFTIPMAPKPQSRGRVGAMRIGTNADGSARYRGMIFEDKKSKEHKATLRSLAMQHKPAEQFTGPVEVRILAVFPRPAALCQFSKRDGKPLQPPGRRWHTSRPDKDNVEKAVLDALKDWWIDDSQVCVGCTFKQVAALGEDPHYEIYICDVSATNHNGNAHNIQLSDFPSYWFMGFPF